MAGRGFSGCVQLGQPRALRSSERQRAEREALAEAGRSQQQSQEKPQTAPIHTLAAGSTGGSSRESPTSATDTACDKDTELALASSPQQRFWKTPREMAEDMEQSAFNILVIPSPQKGLFGKGSTWLKDCYKRCGALLG